MKTIPTHYTMGDKKVNPFDSFSAVYEVMKWLGLYKLLNKPKNRFKWICYQFYRAFALVAVVEYHIMHLIFIIQRLDDSEVLVDGMRLLTPQMNMIIKIVTLNWNIPKIEKINMLINDPIFGPYSKKDEEMLLKTTRTMHLCIKLMKIGISVCIFMWIVSLFAARFQDPSAVMSAYVPFQTDTWPRYTFSVILQAVPVLWVGYGQLGIDILIVTYYAQAEVQLKIIKYNLEHLFDTDNATDADGAFQYKDVLDKDIRTRFVHYVQRYDAVVWYINEIRDVFHISMTFEFFSASATLCFTTVQLSSIPIMSVSFAFLVIFLIVLLTQLFGYCYFGNLVQDESDSVMTSIYLSDWASTSPQFRRLLLIAMPRWSHSLTPTIAGIVPLSLTTFVSILKSAYSLFALLSTKQ